MFLGIKQAARNFPVSLAALLSDGRSAYYRRPPRSVAYSIKASLGMKLSTTNRYLFLA